MDFENFLTQQEADTKGRTLQDIWNFTDTEGDNRFGPDPKGRS
jgi:hypothetical protein